VQKLGIPQSLGKHAGHVGGAERRSLMIVMAATEILARSTTLTSVGWIG
jgi:hypothetical protein